ncbi:MAG: hypothetical protein ACKVSF_16475 [Alphaproteobacteria bacterium]
MWRTTPFGWLLSAEVADQLGMDLGLAWNFYVFARLPRAARRWGTRASFWGALAVAGLGLPLVLLPHLGALLAGLALIGTGTFFAQAVATGFVGRVARGDRASASGIYLACYFLGGLAGSAALGAIFMRSGWLGCIAAIGASLAVAAWLARRLEDSAP